MLKIDLNLSWLDSTSFLRKFFYAVLINKSDRISIQLLKYAIVGAMAYGVDFGSLFFLTEVLRIYYLISAAIAFLLGLTTNYVLSISWVFAQRSVNNRKIEFTVFSIIGIVGLFFNEGIMWLFTERAEFHYLISKIISTIFVFFWNFLARKKILFS